jgi:hypothetical protein
MKTKTFAPRIVVLALIIVLAVGPLSVTPALAASNDAPLLLTCPSGMSCGMYTVSGLHNQKNALLSVGGNTLDMAVAMLETETMKANYAYGDNKTGDAANFGIFKQNWLMIRSSVPQYSGTTANEWNWGAALNSNLSWDVQVLHASQNHYGMTKWFAGHRNGQSGLNNPNTTDINRYKTAVYWIQSQINSNSKYKTDDTRFWVSVPAI